MKQLVLTIKSPTLEQLLPNLIIEFDPGMEMMFTADSMKNILKNYRDFHKPQLIKYFLEQREIRRKLKNNEKAYINEFLNFLTGLKTLLFESFDQSFINFISSTNEMLLGSLMSINVTNQMTWFCDSLNVIFNWMLEFCPSPLLPEEKIEIKQKGFNEIVEKRDFLKNSVKKAKEQIADLFFGEKYESLSEENWNNSFLLLNLIFSDLVFGSYELETREVLIKILELDKTDQCIREIIS